MSRNLSRSLRNLIKCVQLIHKSFCTLPCSFLFRSLLKNTKLFIAFCFAFLDLNMGQHSGCVSITVLDCFCPFQKIPTRGVGRKKTLVDTVNVSFYAVMEASNFLVKRPINEFMSHCIAVVRSRFYTDCSISCNLSPPNHTRQNQTISNHTNP